MRARHVRGRRRGGGPGARSVAFAAVFSAALACQRSERAPHEVDRAPVVPPSGALASALPDAEGIASPSWWNELPGGRPAVTAGARAWATLPQAGGALSELSVVDVESVEESTVAVRDAALRRFDRVPAALVHPLGDRRAVRSGELVLFDGWTTPGSIGVAGDDGAALRVRYDASGTTRDVPVEHAEPLRRGVEPLAVISFPRSQVRLLALVVAVDSERAWVLTESGHVDRHPRSDLRTVELGRGAFAVGTPVEAHRWGVGFERGTVARVLEPGLRYEVSLASSRATTSSFISALVSR